MPLIIDTDSGTGGGRQTVLLPGSPFASRAALITASQANPAQLFNNNETVTIAVVTGDPTPANNGTFEWTGATGSYNGFYWVDFNGLDAQDIKALYESNPNTNAFTNSQESSVNSVIALDAGVIPVAFAGGFANSPITQANALGIQVDGTIQTTKDTLYVGQALSISEDGLDIRADNIVEGISALPMRTILNSDGTTGQNLAVVRANRQTVAIQPVDSTVFTGRLTAWVPITATRIVKQLIVRFAAAGTGIRITLRDSTNQTSTNGAILYQSHTTFDWENGGGFSVPATGDFVIDIQNSAKFIQGRFVYVVVEQNTQGTGSLQIKGVVTTISGINQFYPYLMQTFVLESNAELATKSSVVNDVTAGHKINIDKTVPTNPTISVPTNTASILSANFSVTSANATLMEESTILFNNASGALTCAIATADVPVGWAAWVGHYNASAVVGSTFVVSITGGTIDGAASYTGQKNTAVRLVKTSASTFSITSNSSMGGGGGIAYTGGTPANQELIVGTGSAVTAQRSNITLSGGKIPNSAIGVNTVQSSNSINLNNSANWQTYRGRRIQFTGSGNYVRGIQTLPDLGTQNFMNSGDFVEVMNIGGTGNYNCQIQTANTGQFLTGALTGNGPVIGISTTTVYRITWNGSNQNWIVTSGTVSGASDQVATYQSQSWLGQDDGSGIYTANDVEIRAGMQLQVQPYSNVCTTANINLNSCQFTFTDHVGAAQFFKYLSNDVAFPLVNIDQVAPSMDATAALAYLDGTVLNTSYNIGKTIQPDGTGILTQITFISGTTMQARLVIADATNLAIGSQLRINAALNTLNNGDFVIQGFTDFSGYTIVQYTNPNASVDLNAGDTLTTVATAAPVLFWRVTAFVQSPTWAATCQFALNNTFTILAELDPNWYTPGVGHVSWIDEVYQAVVAGAGGALHADSDIHSDGVVSGANMRLAGRNLADNIGPSIQGDSVFYNSISGVWNVGSPRVCQLPVPQTLLTSSNYWQVLTFDNTGNISMQFPRFAGVPTSRLDTLQNGDSIRYDSGAQTWYNSRTAGSCFARRHSVSQSVGNLTDVRVAFDTGDSFLGFNSGETGITYDGSTNVGRFTNTSGRRVLITVTYQIPWGINATGIRFSWIRLNGTTGNRVAYVGSGASGSTDITCLNGSATFALDNNQFFEVWVYQGSGTTLDIGNVGGGVDTGYGTRIQITRNNP